MIEIPTPGNPCSADMEEATKLTDEQIQHVLSLIEYVC